MLNIPETVKMLFQTDGIRKNFRVHFPNGELADLTNADIAQESVEFTESLCSQDVLKFGLTEARVIEFETVGVANMYGMIIECGIEIDLSSLSAAEISVIAAGSWDGTYVAAGDSDLGYAFFQVPYGTFRVESCPRDHQTMAHRKVKAYGIIGQLVAISPMEEFKLSLKLPDNPTYNTTLKKALYANIGYYSPGALAEAGYTKEVIKAFSVFNYTANYTLTVKDLDLNTQYEIIVRVRYGTMTLDDWYTPQTEGAMSISTVDALMELDFSGYDIEGFDDALKELDRRFTILSGSTFSKISEVIIDSQFPMNFQVSRIVDGYGARSPKMPVLESIPCFYPYRGVHSKSSTTHFDWVFQLLSKIQIYQANTEIYSFDFETSARTVTFSKFVDSNTDIKIQFSPTYNQKNVYTSNGVFSYTGCYGDFNDFFDAYLELNAEFGKVARSGEFLRIRLNNDDAIPVPASQYSSFWWDEYDVLPIGTIKYNLEGNECFYQFGQGLSIYDMTDNKALKEAVDETETNIEDFLDSCFIPHLSPITFTPIDLTMIGLPYIEAGDYLAVTAEDGVTAYSFNMRQEISGVQVLEAHVESASGDIIESGEST